MNETTSRLLDQQIEYVEEELRRARGRIEQAEFELARARERAALLAHDLSDLLESRGADITIQLNGKTITDAPVLGAVRKALADQSRRA